MISTRRIDCFYEDHPQLRIGDVDASDVQSLFDPRVDKGEKDSTKYFSFNPIGGKLVLEASDELRAWAVVADDLEIVISVVEIS